MSTLFPQTKPTELAVINVQNAVQIFNGGLDALLDGVEAKVRAMTFDPSTPSGREEIRSVAYQIARTKTAIDTEGKKLTETWRESTKKVNDERKRSSERLEAFAEEIRKPLTDYENKERIRVAAHESALAEITGLREMLQRYPDMKADDLSAHLQDLATLHAQRDWEEFNARATTARSETTAYVSSRIEARTKADVEQAELARLRKEEQERLQRERDERLKAEAAEKARLEAERIAKEEAARAKAASEKALQEAEQSRAREEAAKLAAEQRVKQAEEAATAAKKKAEADQKAAVDKAKKEAEDKAAREAERIEKEQKLAEDARIKREADESLRKKVRSEIIDDLSKLDLSREQMYSVADALMSGAIRNVRVVL